MEDKFSEDTKREQIVSSLMDRYVYSQIKGCEIKRIPFQGHEDEQFKGCDLIFTYHTKGFDIKQALVDEKSANDYATKDLRTFALELSYIKDDIEHDGWFIDDTKATIGVR